MLRRLTSIHVISICLIALIVFYGSAGVRGTDQYWYIGDTQNLIDGDYSQQANIRFPGIVLRDNGVKESNYLLHNGYMLHLSALVGKFTGAYNAWIIINYLLHVLISVCIFWSARRFITDSQAGWISALYLASPVALWQTINPLLEMSFAAITALCMLTYVYREVQGVRYLLTAFLTLGILSHPIFLIPAIIWTGFIFTDYKRFNFFDIAYGLITVLFFLVAYLVKDKVFPSSFQPNLQAIISSAVPGKSNMFWHYSDVQLPIDLAFMVEKAITAVTKHFSIGKFTPFYLFTNLAFVSLLYLLVFRFRQRFIYIAPAVLFLGLYVGMIVLQQNHHRYQQIVAPVSFIVLCMVASHFPIRYFKVLAPGLLFATLAINVVLANNNRSDALHEAKDIDQLVSASRWIESDARVVMVDIYPHNPFAYALAPRTLLSVRTDLLQADKISKAIDLFDPTHVVSTKAIEELLPLSDLELVQEVAGNMYVELYFYKKK